MEKGALADRGGAIQFPGGSFVRLWTNAFHGALFRQLPKHDTKTRDRENSPSLLPPLSQYHDQKNPSARPSTVFATIVDGVGPLDVENSQPSPDTTLLAVSPEKLSGLRSWKVVCEVLCTVT
jgi:hypothetical protein